MNVFPVCDSHLHLSNLRLDCLEEKSFPLKICTCALSLNDFLAQEKKASLLRKSGVTVLCALGVHPLFLSSLYVSELENCLRSTRCVIGEIGLDFFTSEMRSKEKEQIAVFCQQAELSESYSRPVVLHSRKAIGKIFSNPDVLQKLKKCPSVVFHGFEGSSGEAKALLKRGVNAYFSIGKTLLKGDKSAIDCVKKIEKSRLLFETDSPYQTLYGQTASFPSDCAAVIEKASEIADFDFAATACSVFDSAFFQNR